MEKSNESPEISRVERKAQSLFRAYFMVDNCGLVIEGINQYLKDPTVDNANSRLQKIRFGDMDPSDIREVVNLLKSKISESRNLDFQFELIEAGYFVTSFEKRLLDASKVDPYTSTGQSDY